MEEVSEEEEGCERGVPHSMCPWLFSAPALLRVDQVGGGGLKEEEVCWTLSLAVPGAGPGFWVLLSFSFSPSPFSTSSCLLTWLALLSDLITVYKSKASCQPHSLH